MSSTRTFRRPESRKTFAEEPDAPGPAREVIGPTILADGTRDWSRYNATVVGNLPPPPGAPLHPRELPGLAEARERGLAAQAAYLATRKTYTYANEDEGWQRVKGKAPRKKRVRITEEDE